MLEQAEPEIPPIMAIMRYANRSEKSKTKADSGPRLIAEEIPISFIILLIPDVSKNELLINHEMTIEAMRTIKNAKIYSITAIIFPVMTARGFTLTIKSSTMFEPFSSMIARMM